MVVIEMETNMSFEDFVIKRCQELLKSDKHTYKPDYDILDKLLQEYGFLIGDENGDF